MSTVNIGKDKNDMSYRYKMPRLVAKVEGRGNGIKTVIVNMADIAKSLKCDPRYPTKFFGIELGAQSKFDKKDDRGAIVNGKHDQPDLAELLDKFIELFILCPRCGLPEIKMSVKKNIKIDCAACGHNALLPTNHKLTGYILKNPPETKGKKGDKDGKKDKKKGKKKRDDDDEEGDEDEGEADEQSDDEQNTPINQENTVHSAAPKAVVVPAMSGKESDDVEWFTDSSAEAAEARKKAELEEMRAASEAKGLKNAENGTIVSNGLPKDSPVVVLQQFLSERKRNPSEILSEVTRIQLARDLDDRERYKILLDGMVDPTDPKKVPEQFSKNAAVFKAACSDTKSSQLFIGALEYFVAKNAKVIPYMGHILQKLYNDGEGLDEDVIISWFEAPEEASWAVDRDTARKLKAKAKVFVEWLKNADEEDEEEDDE